MEYFAFQWHITEACDQRCKHCYIYALGSHAKFQAMALEDMVRAFCRRAGRLPYFYLTGGDPILHPQFWQLAGLLKERDLPFAILGNPFHLTDDVCQKLRDHGCRKYQLSLDGLRETHDRIRRRVQVERPGDPRPGGRGGGAPGGHLRLCPVLPLPGRPGHHLLSPGIPSSAGSLLGEVPGLRGRRVPNHLLPKGPPVDPLPLREGPVPHRRDPGPGHHLRRATAI